ncbi:hypothetical protein EDB85DRAFT_1895414 [Lactarius pseudohatsudake]|nr:hypothetical protein EDB85DRAFT_1895414 [Lactarius pseudohatsudake]
MDDNNLIEGVKTIDNLVLTSDITSQPSISYYPPIFLPRAFELPRDPDEVTPTTLITRKQSTTPTAPQLPPTETPDTNQNYADTLRHRLRATAAEFAPRPTATRPTQVHGVQLALQRPASNLARIPQNVIGTGRPSRNHSIQDVHNRPQIDYSRIRDWYEQTVLTPVRIDAATAIRERINAWRNQIVMEQTSRSTHYTPQQLPTNRSGHFTFPPDPRNDSHDYYPDNRLED